MILRYIKPIGLPRQTLVFVRSKTCVCPGKRKGSEGVSSFDVPSWCGQSVRPERWNRSVGRRHPAGATYCNIPVFSHLSVQYCFDITKGYHFSIPYDLFYQFPFWTNLSERTLFSPFSLILTRKSRQMLPLATFVHQKDGNLPPPQLPFNLHLHPTSFLTNHFI